MTKEELTKRLGKGTLILDGATGSNLMKAGMPKGICTEPVSYTHLLANWICCI